VAPRQIIEAWRIDYNTVRPHRSLDNGLLAGSMLHSFPAVQPITNAGLDKPNLVLTLNCSDYSFDE
jgi:hypothetical protein